MSTGYRNALMIVQWIATELLGIFEKQFLLALSPKKYLFVISQKRNINIF